MTNGEQALSTLPTYLGIRVADSKLRMPGPVVEVILLTGHGAVDTAVKGLRSGAFDYLLKPADFDELIAKLEAGRKQKDAHAERLRAAEARALMRRSRGLFKRD